MFNSTFHFSLFNSINQNFSNFVLNKPFAILGQNCPNSVNSLQQNPETNINTTTFTITSEFSFIFKNNQLMRSWDSISSGLFFQEVSNDLTYIHTQLIVMLVLAAVLYYLSKLLSKKIFNLDKKSSYECGFEPFLILTTFIEVGFILVAFIFLIFDLELIFLSAFLVSNGSVGSFGILLCLTYLWSVWVMVFFEIFTGILSWPVWNIFKIGGGTLRKINFRTWSEYHIYAISARRLISFRRFLFKNSIKLNNYKK